MAAAQHRAADAQPEPLPAAPAAAVAALAAPAARSPAPAGPAAVHHVLVTRGGLVEALAKLLAFGVDTFNADQVRSCRLQAVAGVPYLWRIRRRGAAAGARSLVHLQRTFVGAAKARRCAGAIGVGVTAGAPVLAPCTQAYPTAARVHSQLPLLNCCPPHYPSDARPPPPSTPACLHARTPATP
jgi:hypothetical protein